MNLTSGERDIIKFSLMQRVQRTGIQTVSTDTEEFFNKHHGWHGRFAPTDGSKAAPEAKKESEPKKEHTVNILGRKVSIKKIAVAAAAVVIVAGLLYVAYAKAPGTMEHSKAARHSAHLEGLLNKGGPDLDATIKDKTAKALAGHHVQRNLRDLEVLQHNGFLDQDDAAEFLKDLKQKDYSKEERQALWDYAGLFSEKDEATGMPVMGKGPVIRYNMKLRDPEGYGSPTKKDLRVLKIVNQAIEKNKLPRDVTLYRGMYLANADADFYANLKPGSVFSDKAPMFTGLTAERARPHYAHNKFPKEQKPTLFVIHAKKGLPAIHSPYGESVVGRKVPIPNQYIAYKHVPQAVLKKQRYVRAPFIEHLNKEEIILRANQGLKLLSTHTRKDGVFIVDVEAADL